MQLNRLPTYNENLTQGGKTSKSWYAYFAGLFTGQPTGPVSAVTVNANPFTYQASAAGTLIVSGGTTTQVQFSRDGANFYLTGVTAGMFPVSQGDILVITYSVGPPTVTFAPR